MSRSLAISIVNTNQWDWLEPCLSSLNENPYTLGRCETVVLDNASTDGSVEHLRSRFPQVRVVAERIRRGFGANHGIVAEAIDADLILFLNPDTIMQPGTLDRMVESFGVDERVVLAGGPILDPNGKVWRAAPFPFPTPLTSVREAVGLHRIRDLVIARPGISVGVGWISGSAFMVDRRAFQAVGGFDPRYFLYFEETDLARRLIDTGGLIGFHSEAPVVHEGRTTERAITQQAFDGDRTPTAPETKTTTEYERSAIAYMRKHFGLKGSVVYRASVLGGAGLRLVCTYIPFVASKMELRGSSIVTTRQHHRRRIGVAIRPRSGVSMEDFAADWNIQHRATGRGPAV